MAGRLSRHERVLVVLAWTQLVGLGAVVVLLVASGEPFPGWGEMWPALLAGAVGPVALGCFYRGLAIGTMSVVAPISATSVVVPTVAGLMSGDRPSALAGIGIAFAAVGIVFASRETAEAGADSSRASIVLALIAAAGFGVFLTSLAGASDASTPWALFLARGVSAAICLVALSVVATGERRTFRRADLRVVLAVGVLDVLANTLYAVATTKGLLAIVGVLGSLYPVTTVILARVLLGERLNRAQQTGVVLAFCGVALISL